MDKNALRTDERQCHFDLHAKRIGLPNVPMLPINTNRGLQDRIQNEHCKSSRVSKVQCTETFRHVSTFHCNPKGPLSFAVKMSQTMEPHEKEMI